MVIASTMVNIISDMRTKTSLLIMQMGRRTTQFTMLLCVAVPLLIVSFRHDHRLAFYTPSNVESYSLSTEPDFSALQAEALLRGRLDVLPVPTELLALENPYDPKTNIKAARGRGYHDLSYYKGKIYAPQGFGASVLIDIPTRVLGLGYATPPLKILTALVIGSWSLAMLVLGIFRRRPDTRQRMIEVVILAAVVIVANPATWLLTAGRAYQVPVAAAYMALSAAALILHRTLSTRTIKGPRRFLYLCIASVLVLLGVVARPTVLPVGVLLAVGSIVWTFVSKDVNRIRLSELVALVIPALAVTGLWLWFNQARFGDPFETGHVFQLAGFNMREYPVGSVGYLAENLRSYLLTPYRFSREYPFFSLADPTTSQDINVQGREKMVGVLVAYPQLLVGPVLLMTWFVIHKRWSSAVFAFSCITASTCSLVLASILFKDSTMRYVPDFTLPLLFLVAWGTLVVLNRNPIRGTGLSRSFGYLVLGTCLYSAAVSAGIIMTVCFAC